MYFSRILKSAKDHNNILGTLLLYCFKSAMSLPMPRQPRLDAPGYVFHVIVRGIEKNAIFQDDSDRNNLVQRIHDLLADTVSQCLAWALIPNHAHLLLRPGAAGLAHFMRRLLTGYAVSYNRRHRRSGHLFQNRYKSILCDEDAYLLELIRYIHLNPLNAGLCKSLTELDTYPWSGHRELIGHQQGVRLITDDALLVFGGTRESGCKVYRQMIADGINEPTQFDRFIPDQDKISSAEPDFVDDRIYGSDDFIARLEQTGVLLDSDNPGVDLPTAEQILLDYYQLPDLSQRGRQNATSDARAVFCFVATQMHKQPGSMVAKKLGIGNPSVSRAVRKGREILRANDELSVRLQPWKKQ
jgi:REP element-mobilizing transposase RayT